MGSLSVSNDLQFLREFLARPRVIASPVPSGPALARRVAQQIDPRPGGAVLELGPGTGPVTRAILDSGISEFELIGIESDRRFVALLRRQLPRVRIVEGNAFSFAGLLGDEALGLRSIVSGLPVVGQSPDLCCQFLRDALSALRPGRPLIQFSYSLRPPLPCYDGVEVRRAAIVWQNLPPMHIWSYRQGARNHDRSGL
jgi:phosphatidylethanolamine/phosphatidyl-N-methylethanolamine N-methyltransferase